MTCRRRASSVVRVACSNARQEQNTTALRWNDSLSLASNAVLDTGRTSRSRKPPVPRVRTPTRRLSEQHLSPVPRVRTPTRHLSEPHLATLSPKENLVSPITPTLCLRKYRKSADLGFIELPKVAKQRSTQWAEVYDTPQLLDEPCRDEVCLLSSLRTPKQTSNQASLVKSTSVAWSVLSTAASSQNDLASFSSPDIQNCSRTKRQPLNTQWSDLDKTPHGHEEPDSKVTSGRMMMVIERLPSDVKIFDLYYWEQVLQEQGNGGKVVVCQPKGPTDTQGAQSFDSVMKIRSKASLNQHNLEKPFRKTLERMLNMPRHPGVMPLDKVLEDDMFYYTIMQKANGGSLFKSLMDDFGDGCMPVSAMKQLMRGILEAVSHIHKNGVLHRDIKPDNLVMHQSGDSGSGSGNGKHVMLIDFDHADIEWNLDKGQEADGIFGTLRFNAPETFIGFYSKQSDLYSVGTILFLLMTGKFPFDDSIFTQDDYAATSTRRSGRQTWGNEIFKRMRANPIDFTGELWASQPACKEVCQQLLALEPRQRFASADETLQHDWFTQECVQ